MYLFKKTTNIASVLDVTQKVAEGIAARPSCKHIRRDQVRSQDGMPASVFY